MSDLKEVIESSFIQYAGAVLQSRALVDVRDCLKPSARQIFYCLYTDKFTYNKPFKKTLKGVGSASRLHIHGDSSCLGIIMRAGQPFAMRYPLVEIEGSYGNLMSSGNWAAPRYTASRLSEISDYLFGGIKKNTIEEWRDNYDNTEQYPAVLPSIGFYNIVNGTMGIGIGAASSIPPTNLKEVNNAIIKLIRDENVSDKEILCIPDFPTGGILLNRDEVAEAMLKGQGKSCRIRSVINYDEKDNCLIVTELPYALYTDTVCGELEAILEDEDNKIIERFNDLTGKEPLIKIYLKKGVNPKRAMDYLYKNTSLENWFAINMTMLENGRFPRVFGWREALLNYITHIRTCKRREYQFDLDKMLARKNIVEGLMIAAANIDEVVAIIRASDSPSTAGEKLIAHFGFNEEQTKAILAMKLSSLTRIDGIKLEKEFEELKKNITEYQHILNTPTLFDEKLIEILQEVANKFGDERRTKIMNVEEEEEEEVVEEKPVSVLVLSNDTVRIVSNEIEGAKKGRKGKAMSLPKNTKVLDTLYTTNLSRICAVGKKGKMFTFSISALKENEDYSIYDLAGKNSEEIIKIFSITNLEYSKYVVFFTKQGMIKKSLTSEYSNIAKRGTVGIKLRENDEVVNCCFAANDEANIIIVSNIGNCVRYSLKDITPTGRNTIGVMGIKLNKNEYVIGAEVEYGEGVLTINSNGKGKITSLDQILTNSRQSRGSMIMKLEKDEEVKAFILVKEEDTGYNIIQDNKVVSIDKNDIQHSGRMTIGTKLINIRKENDIKIFRK